MAVTRPSGPWVAVKAPTRNVGSTIDVAPRAAGQIIVANVARTRLSQNGERILLGWGAACSWRNGGIKRISMGARRS